MKIECTLSNAGTNIRGVEFAKSDHGTMISVKDVAPILAAKLLRIEGFKAVQSDPPKENSQSAEKEVKKK